MGCTTNFRSRKFLNDPIQTLPSPKKSFVFSPLLSKRIVNSNSRFLQKLGDFHSELNVILESPSDIEVSFLK